MASSTSRPLVPRNRCRSPLKIQTASCLLSAAAVLGVTIMPVPFLGAAASPLGTPSLVVTPTASPATSPVMAYFGEDVLGQSTRSGEWKGQPEGFNAEIMETIDVPNNPSVTYPASSSATPASPFLLQVDAPNDSPVSRTLPADSPERRKVKRVTSSAEKFSDASSSLSASAASFSWISNDGFTVHENIASTYSPSAQPVSTSSSSAASSSSTTAPSSAQVSIPTASTSVLPLATPFPQPFDQSLSYSLSTSCVAFLASYLGSEEMLGNASHVSRSRVGRCGRPFGLLMSSSSVWAQIARNETMLNAAMSQICYATDTEECSRYYQSLAVDIQRNANCGADIRNKKAVAVEALYGFQNYDMLQSAACLKDSETETYCYVSAMSMSSPPDDGYLYSLSSGISLPSTSKPTCSSCSAKLINLYTQTIINATDGTSTAAGTQYSFASVLEPALTNATALIKQTCGSTFAGQSTTMQAHVSSGSARKSSPPGIALSLALAVILLFAFSNLG